MAKKPAPPATTPPATTWTLDPSSLDHLPVPREPGSRIALVFVNTGDTGHGKPESAAMRGHHAQGRALERLQAVRTRLQAAEGPDAMSDVAHIQAAEQEQRDQKDRLVRLIQQAVAPLLAEFVALEDEQRAIAEHARGR